MRFFVSIFICLSSFNCLANGVLTLAVDDSPPYSFVDQSNNIDGLNVKIARKLADELGLTLKPVFCPWARCLELVKVGKLDLLLGVNKDEDRERWLHYVDPPFYVGEQHIGFFVLEDQPEINHYGDLKNLRIGVLRGSLYFPKFDLDNKLFKVSVTKVETLINMLVAGKLDAVIHVIPTMSPYLAQFDTRNRVTLASYQSLVRANGYLAVSKKSSYSNQLQSFSKAMEGMISRGEIIDLFNSYEIEPTEQMRKAANR